MIHIGKPFITNNDKHFTLNARVDISDDTAMKYKDLEKSLYKTHWRTHENYPPVEWQRDDSSLFFRVPEEYGRYLCDSRSDSFVVAMLWYAMMTQSDIEFEAPISEKMYFGITQLLLPALCKKQPIINLKGPISNDAISTEHAVGTGMSCGVDSLYSLKKYTSSTVPEDYQLTHLAYFNMGAIFHPDSSSGKVYNLHEFYEETDRMSLEKMKNASEVAEKKGLPLLYVESNLDKDFYRGAYGYTGVYRNIASVLAVQKLFGRYYCSSAGWPEFFDLSLTEGSEHYETLLCDALSTESLQFIISDYATRLEKTEALADDEIAMNYLDVCFNFNNCGKCSKCFRTLITLDTLDKLDSFSKVFDIEGFKNNRESAYAWLLETKNGDRLNDNAVFARDIYDFIHLKGKHIPQKAYQLYYKKKLINIAKQGKRKLKKQFAK